MKEENKYYIPQIEEFHVGFDYETRVAGYDAEWISSTIYAKFEKGWESNLEEEVSMYIDGGNEFRVKYLDSEDIEELGFTKDKKKPTKFDFILGTKYILNHYNLYLSDDNKRIIITANDLTRAYDYDAGPKENTLFNGKIKNKSKLKEVLQMIGIDYEKTTNTSI